MKRPIRLYLNDIIEAGEKIERFTENLSYEEGDFGRLRLDVNIKNREQACVQSQYRRACQ